MLPSYFWGRAPGTSAARYPGDDRRDLAEASPSEWLRPSREAAALRIREAESPSSQLLTESPILGFQILDNVLLLAADPSDPDEQQELNRERHHDPDASSMTASHNRCASPRSQYDQPLDFGMVFRRRSFGTIRQGIFWRDQGIILARTGNNRGATQPESER